MSFLHKLVLLVASLACFAPPAFADMLSAVTATDATGKASLASAALPELPSLLDPPDGTSLSLALDPLGYSASLPVTPVFPIGSDQIDALDPATGSASTGVVVDNGLLTGPSRPPLLTDLPAPLGATAYGVGTPGVTVVPLPAPVLLLLSGLFALGAARRRSVPG